MGKQASNSNPALFQIELVGSAKEARRTPLIDLIEVRFGNSRDGRNVYKTFFQVLDPLGSGLKTISRKDAEKLVWMRVVNQTPTVTAGRKLRTVQSLREHHAQD